jgi:uncharacterized protein GlcG (DUF336 family)
MEKTFKKSSITSELALAMIRAAEEKARELGVFVATAIVDESGVLKAFNRMDNAPLISVGVSKKKAITAVSFGIATGSTWYNLIKDDPIAIQGVQKIDDFILLGGGQPVRVHNTLIGGIGVSGGNTRQDEACALAALEILNQE